MTYSYLLSVPLIATYAIGFAVIKYKEGFVQLPFYGVVPKPYTLWAPSSRSAIFPLMLSFSFGWTFEMITHLEELCFWLFLVNSGSSQRDWFHSLYFKTWLVGAVVAFYVPLVTIFTRDSPLQSEAYVFLSGSLGSLSLTLWFMPVLWTFPSFLRSLRSQGVDMTTIVRLTKFSELNTIRVVFRLLFTVPLLILGVDGVRPHKHVNENMFATDFLAMVAGFGCAISSAITLVIFFPRSIEGEIAQRDASIERKRARSLGRSASVADSHYFTRSNMTQSIHGSNYPSNYPASPVAGGGNSGHTYLLTSSPVKNNYSLPAESLDGHFDATRQPERTYSMDKYSSNWTEEERDTVPNNLAPIRPNRRKGQDVELGGVGVDFALDETSRGARASNLNPMVHNYTSPIMLASATGQSKNGENYLTFNRR